MPEWRYVVVANTDTGQLSFDNYENKWGDRIHLDRFLQRYAVEAATIAARKQSHSVIESRLDDGSVKLTVGVGGEA